MSERHGSRPGERGWDEDDARELRRLADSLEPCLAITVDAATNSRTRPPEDYIWTADQLRCLPVPEDWEHLVIDRWPTLVRRKVTPDRAVGCLRLEIERRYAPKSAEEEWDRQNAPRKSRWGRERGRVVGILEAVHFERMGTRA